MDISFKRVFISKIMGIVIFLFCLYADPILFNSKYYFINLILGILLVVVGVLGRIFSSIFLSNKRAKTLVSTGIYSTVRNPLYLFSWIALNGILLVYSSVIIFSLCNFVFFMIYYPSIKSEEKYLLNIFTADYQNYMKLVPRFIPKLSLYFEDNVSYTISSSVIKNTLLQSLMFFLAMLMILGILYIKQIFNIHLFFIL